MPSATRPPRRRDGADRLLGVLAAHLDAVAAVDATLAQDAGLQAARASARVEPGVGDADGLGRTFAHARVADATAVAHGGDE